MGGLQTQNSQQERSPAVAQEHEFSARSLDPEVSEECRLHPALRSDPRLSLPQSISPPTGLILQADQDFAIEQGSAHVTHLRIEPFAES